MIVKLSTGTMAMLDKNEPFILPDALEIELCSSIYSLNTLAVTIKNGDIKEKFTLKDKPYIIKPEKTLRAGALELAISNVINGEIVKTWRVPSIILIEVGHTFEAIPEIEELRKEIATIKQGMAEILKLI